jgi:hypothetical protein
LIPAGNLYEVAYEDLTKQPVESLARAYEELSLGGFDAAKPKLEAYTQAKSSYQKNKHAEMPAEQREILHTRWARMFDELGYAKTNG